MFFEHAPSATSRKCDQRPTRKAFEVILFWCSTSLSHDFVSSRTTRGVINYGAVSADLVQRTYPAFWSITSILLSTRRCRLPSWRITAKGRDNRRRADASPRDATRAQPKVGLRLRRGRM